MKKEVLALALFIVWIVGCNSTLKAAAIREKEMNDKSASNFSDVTGKEWKLIEVRINDSGVGFNRDILIREGVDQFFTVNFDTDIVSGTGAPNLYSAPYTTGDNHSISIAIMRSTMMASFFQLENFTEHDFFTFMHNSHEWRLVNNNLELRSKTADGSAALLVFSL